MSRLSSAPIAYCAFHGILMNQIYIRRKGCMCPRNCRRAFWYDHTGITGRVITKRSATEVVCELQEGI